MKRYDTYKPSGIEWLGEIPEHWEVKRVKDVTKYVKTGTTPAASKGDFFTDGTEIWFTPSDINNGNIENSNRKVTISAFEERELTFFPENSVYLIGIGGTQGKVAICSIKASCNQQINVLVGSKVVFPRFLFYQIVVTGSTLLKWSNYTTMPIFTQSDTKYLGFILPQYSEQTAIANYLDTKTAAIDRKLELLTAKIDKYKALRRSLINETVCRGLNPNAPLKDSGIEWIGMIPAHWEIKRMKSLGEIETSSVDKKTLDNEALIKLVNYTDIYGNTNKEIWNNDNYMIVSANEKQLKSKKLRTGDVLFTPSSETIEDIGVSAVVMEDLNNTLYSYHILRFKFYEILDLKFKKYMLNNDFVQYYFSKSASGTTRKILGLNIFWNLHVILPPLAEQIEIGQYLDEKTTQIDTILTNIGEQINKLTQLRKTLINDVVTGQLKVTD